MAANPFDPNNALLKVDCGHKPIVIAFDVEHNSIGGDDACSRIKALNLRRASPMRLLDLLEPRVERRTQRSTVASAPTLFDKFAKRAPGDDAHELLPCTQFGRNAILP